ncbi:hypothetical protein GCM10022215_07090 [Nocardioides fonticola]|uniref:ER-bound oxygenase mpaB/mpaB'/Rubber oxygenase catalytic domain-containing protein n=1 Tax=Nocardioides fonticola TaxID=450363 RepID=A0ABP7XDF6_9ACTN
MTVVDSLAAPTRHRSAERRGATLGRPLRRIAGVEELDEALMDRLGEAYLQCDPLGGAVAEAMRLPAGDPARVTHAAVRRALAAGPAGAHDDGLPASLRTLLATTSADPDWLDRDLLAVGQRVYRGWGRAASDVLLQLALIGGYRFGGPTDLLVATGALTGDQTRRRLAETQSWTLSLSEPGGLEPGGEAWRLTLHVRVMHAVVNREFAPRWDVAHWGLPINDADQAATLGLFDAVCMLGVRALGVPVSREDSRAVMHLWRYVGWLMGVHEDFLVATERERHRLNYHILVSQAELSEAGPQLARAIVDVQRHLDFAPLPAPLAAIRGHYERERLLSMLTVFLGTRSMREMGLPMRPPWAIATSIAQNVVRYRVLARVPGGRRVLGAVTEREVAALLARYGGGQAHAVAPIPEVATPTG